MTDKLLDVHGAAQLLNLSVSTVREYHRTGRYQFPAPVMKLGGANVWNRDDLEKWQANR